MAGILLLGLLVLLGLGLGPVEGFRPRRVLFAKCDDPYETSVKPKSVFMTCANSNGVCEVRAGGTHNLQAIFVPTINSTSVDSYVRWNSWFEVPLPGQLRDVCGEGLRCPVQAGEITRFTYKLDLQDFWPRNEYPVIWSLTDKVTNEEFACWKFKINIV